MENTLFFSGKIFVLDDSKILQLKQLALNHPLRRSRICLHNSREEFVQEMIIVAHKDSHFEEHRHPINKPESYHVIEGELEVRVYSDVGEVIETILLSHNSSPRMYRIQGNVWHRPIVISEWTIYHEVYTGPFNKDFDIMYKNW